MNLNSAYRLAPGVQVRDEVFGLLFYDYRGPRLYFVPSRSLIGESFFSGRVPLADLVERCSRETPGRRQWIQDQLVKVLQKLERKGLIREQPLC